MWSGRGALSVLVVSCAVALAVLTVSTNTAPGFYRDESSIALDASLIAESGHDQHGTLLPLYFQSYDDWKSAPYTYLLAGVFAVTGPSELAARGLSATLGVIAAALLGLVAYRLTGRRSIAALAALLAAATPWLFEVSRLVFDVTLQPAVVALLLLLLARMRGEADWSLRQCAAVGVVLALIAYTYAGGRALAPLLALALVVFAGNGHRRRVLRVWACFAVALVPMALFAVSNPHALLVRFGQVSNDTDRGPLRMAVETTWNLLRELDLVSWVVVGDHNLRHHVGGMGSLLAVSVVLAAASVVVLVRSRRWEPFWSYVLLGCVASAIPAAISDVRLHALRSIGLPVFLIVLQVPAIEELRNKLAHRWVRVAAVGLVLAAVGQVAVFARHDVLYGPDRRDAFHADLPGVLRVALRAGPVVVFRDDPDAMGNVTWYAKLWNVPVRVLDTGMLPSAGDVVVATDRSCARCRELIHGGIFVAYVAM